MEDIQKSIRRAADLLAPTNDEGSFVLVKFHPVPYHCACTHCWPETWHKIGQRYSCPDRPIKHGGDLLVEDGDVKFVVESHESGPEVVLPIIVNTLGLIKVFMDFFVFFCKARLGDRRNESQGFRVSIRRITKTPEVEVTQEIAVELPLSKEGIHRIEKSVAGLLTNPAQRKTTRK